MNFILTQMNHGWKCDVCNDANELRQWIKKLVMIKLVYDNKDSKMVLVIELLINLKYS